MVDQVRHQDTPKGAEMIKEVSLFRIKSIYLSLTVLLGFAPGLAAAMPSRIDLFVGDSRVVDAETTRIAVGNGKLVSATLVSAGQFVLIGHATRSFSCGCVTGVSVDSTFA
jgi:hypothetical protein